MFDADTAHTEAEKNASRAGNKELVKPLNALAAVVTQCKVRYARALRAAAEFSVRAAAILHPALHDLTWHVKVLGGGLILYCLDVLVAGAPAAHIVRRAFVYIPLLTEIVTTLARFIVPALVLGMELLLGSLVHRFSSHSPHRNRALQIAAAIAGISIAAAVTTMALMLDLAGQAVAGQEAGSIGFHQVVYYALALLTLVLHVVVLFLGRPGAAAKDFVVAKLTARKLRKAEEKAKDPYERHDAAFVDLATTYLQRVQAHVATFDEQVPYGPFTDTTQSLLHEHFPRHFPAVAPSKAPGLPTPKSRPVKPTWQADNDDVIDVVEEPFESTN